MSIKGRIVELRELVGQLLANKVDLELELRQQQSENEDLLKLVKEQNEQLQNFHNQEKIAKIVEGAVGEGVDKRELKKQINQYIKKIDECIGHLNQ